MNGTTAVLRNNGRRALAAYTLLFVCAMVAVGVSFQTQHDLKMTQRTLAVTTRESALTRVTTVEQRCELTLHIARLLSQGRMPETAWFLGSYTGCEKQLAQVKRIAAAAP